MKKIASPKKLIGITAGIAGLALTYNASVTQVHQDQIGLRENFYVATGDHLLKPKIYVQFPFLQMTHKYKINTEVIDYNAGSCRFIKKCGSTKDRNPLTAEIVLNYRVKPDFKSLAGRRWSMDSWGTVNGYWLLTDLMNVSANSVLGQKSMAENMYDPKKFIDDFYKNFSMRIAQNNIPVEIESIELKGFRTAWFAPVRDVSYGRIQNTAATAIAPIGPS